MWVNYSYIKGTFIWFIYQNGTDSKIKSYWECFGRTQLWDMRRMEEKSNSTGNTSLTYYSQILEPQMELVEESIIVTMTRETVGMKGGRNIWTAFLGRHFYFFPYYSVAAWLSPGKCLMKVISNPTLLMVTWNALETTCGVSAEFGLCSSQRCWDNAWDQRNSAWLLGARLSLRKRDLKKKTPQLVKHIVLTRSHSETKRYDASITKSLFKAGINFWH